MLAEWTTIISVLIFVVLTTVEVILSRRRAMNLYEHHDTIANIALGVITFVSKIGSKAAILAVYSSIFQLAPWKFPENSVPWFFLGLLINDLFFYWYHRLSHTTRFFWALHVAHHSSEKLNFTTSVRGNFVNNLFHAIFWIPMLLLGFPPAIVLTTDLFSYFYQSFLHTQIIPKLGPIESIMNTPSHHRVHHGSNPQYIDKNYGAVFIFWDKLFGTFEEEYEEVRYGLTKPIMTRNPFKIAFHEFWVIHRDMMARKGIAGKVKELFRKP